MFHNSRCSYRKNWDACWRRDCVATLGAEWGCLWPAPRDDDDDGGGGGDGGAARCDTPFARVLVQARHPLRVVESLTVKFCAHLGARPEAPFVRVLSALWPEHDWSYGSCVRVAGW